MRVTEELLESVASGRLQPGLALPSERELSEQFGVSRTVIREAVRGLEAKGVLEVRSGRGSRVAAVSASRVSETMELYLRGAQSQDLIQPSHIAEVRATLELRLVELACERASEADLKKVTTAHHAMAGAKTPETAALCDAEFHRQIATATHNALFVTLLDSINATMMPFRVRSLTLRGRPGRALAQHEAVLQALVARDQVAATTAMADHLADSRQYYDPEPVALS